MKITGCGALAALFMLSLVCGCNKPPASVSKKDEAKKSDVTADSEDLGTDAEDAEKPESSEAPAETTEASKEEAGSETKAAPATPETTETPEIPAETPEEPKAETSEKPAKEEANAEPKKETPAEEKPAKEEPTKEEPMKEVNPETTVAKADPKKEAPAETKLSDEALAANTGVGPKDWPQWGGTKVKNNTPDAKNIPTEWEIGKFDRETGDWDPATAKNIKWVARVGSQTYGNPVIANGKVFVGTNNGAAYIERYPENVDLGCLLCFRESDGKFLWQHSNEKLATGRVHDWPLQGICCSPIVEGNRCWYVSSRGEVVCLDVEGFHDDENDGPVKDEEYTDKTEADVIWRYDMMKELRTSQHNMCSCSVTILGDILFVNTSNGLDESHVNLPSPDAPTFIGMNKNTGEVYWTDASPADNILHGQWSSPTVAKLGGVWQVIFAGGDGWVYSFEANEGKEGKPNFLWKFDANPKETEWILGGAGTRNNIIATPVVYDGLVYVAVGQDPEHGEGVGHMWCIDPTKRGDVSPELAFHVDDLEKPIPHKRIQAVVKEDGEVARPNPNSAVVWHYSQEDIDGDDDISFEETMHRSIGTATIKNDLLVLSDFSGLVHCLDAKTGKPLWTYDMLAASWGSALIAGDKIYIGDEDGDVSIFNLSGDPKIAMNDGEPIAEINMGNSVYSSPIVANDVLYIANKTHIFAIEDPSAADKKEAAAEEKPAEAKEAKPAEEKAEEKAEKPAAEAKATEEAKPAKEEAPAESKEEAAPKAEKKPAAEEKPAKQAEKAPAKAEKPAAEAKPAKEAEAAPAKEAKPVTEEAKPVEEKPAEEAK